MGFVPGTASRIVVDTFHMSTVLNKLDHGDNVVVLDKTVFTSPAKEYLAGITGSGFTAGGFIDTLASSGMLTLLDGWKSTAAKPVSIGVAGFALASPVTVFTAIESQFKIGAEADGIAAFDLTAETNGMLDYGFSLHDLVAETDTGNGTAFDGGAATANGGAANLHITALATVTNFTVKIQHSTTGVGSWVDLVTFTLATGATSEHLEVAAGTTVNRYLRASWTATGGPGLITFHTNFARR